MGVQNIIVVPDSFKVTRSSSEVCRIKKEAVQATSYRVGELMAHAIGLGAKKLIVELDESCMKDGGTGAAVALGTVFYDQEGKPFIPTKDTLKEIRRIDDSYTKKLLREIEIIIMYENEEALCGEEGIASMADFLNAELQMNREVHM